MFIMAAAAGGRRPKKPKDTDDLAAEFAAQINEDAILDADFVPTILTEQTLELNSTLEKSYKLPGTTFNLKDYQPKKIEQLVPEYFKIPEKSPGMKGMGHKAFKEWLINTTPTMSDLVEIFLSEGIDSGYFRVIYQYVKERILGDGTKPEWATQYFQSIKTNYVTLNSVSIVKAKAEKQKSKPTLTKKQQEIKTAEVVTSVFQKPESISKIEIPLAAKTYLTGLKSSIFDSMLVETKLRGAKVRQKDVSCNVKIPSSYYSVLETMCSLFSMELEPLVAALVLDGITKYLEAYPECLSDFQTVKNSKKETENEEESS